MTDTPFYARFVRSRLVIEHGGQHVSGIEVKAAATVTTADFRGLRKLRDATGRRFTAGVVLYRW